MEEKPAHDALSPCATFVPADHDSLKCRICGFTVMGHHRDSRREHVLLDSDNDESQQQHQRSLEERTTQQQPGAGGIVGGLIKGVKGLIGHVLSAVGKRDEDVMEDVDKAFEERMRLLFSLEHTSTRFVEAVGAMVLKGSDLPPHAPQRLVQAAIACPDAPQKLFFMIVGAACFRSNPKVLNLFLREMGKVMQTPADLKMLDDALRQRVRDVNELNFLHGDLIEACLIESIPDDTAVLSDDDHHHHQQSQASLLIRAVSLLILCDPGPYGASGRIVGFIEKLDEKKLCCPDTFPVEWVSALVRNALKDVVDLPDKDVFYVVRACAHICRRGSKNIGSMSPQEQQVITEEWFQVMCNAQVVGKVWLIVVRFAFEETKIRFMSAEDFLLTCIGTSQALPLDCTTTLIQRLGQRSPLSFFGRKMSQRVFMSIIPDDVFQSLLNTAQQTLARAFRNDPSDTAIAQLNELFELSCYNGREGGGSGGDEMPKLEGDTAMDRRSKQIVEVIGGLLQLIRVQKLAEQNKLGLLLSLKYFSVSPLKVTAGLLAKLLVSVLGPDQSQLAQVTLFFDWLRKASRGSLPGSRVVLPLNVIDGSDDEEQLAEIRAALESCSSTFRRSFSWLLKIDLFPDDREFPEGRQTLLTYVWAHAVRLTLRCACSTFGSTEKVCGDLKKTFSSTNAAKSNGQLILLDAVLDQCLTKRVLVQLKEDSALRTQYSKLQTKSTLLRTSLLFSRSIDGLRKEVSDQLDKPDDIPLTHIDRLRSDIFDIFAGETAEDFRTKFEEKVEEPMNGAKASHETAAKFLRWLQSMVSTARKEQQAATVGGGGPKSSRSLLASTANARKKSALPPVLMLLDETLSSHPQNVLETKQLTLSIAEHLRSVFGNLQDFYLQTVLNPITETPSKIVDLFVQHALIAHENVDDISGALVRAHKRLLGDFLSKGVIDDAMLSSLSTVNVENEMALLKGFSSKDLGVTIKQKLKHRNLETRGQLLASILKRFRIAEKDEHHSEGLTMMLSDILAQQKFSPDDHPQLKLFYQLEEKHFELLSSVANAAEVTRFIEQVCQQRPLHAPQRRQQSIAPSDLLLARVQGILQTFSTASAQEDLSFSLLHQFVEVFPVLHLLMALRGSPLAAFINCVTRDLQVPAGWSLEQFRLCLKELNDNIGVLISTIEESGSVSETARVRKQVALLFQRPSNLFFSGDRSTGIRLSIQSEGRNYHDDDLVEFLQQIPLAFPSSGSGEDDTSANRQEFEQARVLLRIHEQAEQFCATLQLLLEAGHPESIEACSAGIKWPINGDEPNARTRERVLSTAEMMYDDWFGKEDSTLRSSWKHHPSLLLLPHTLVVEIAFSQVLTAQMVSAVRRLLPNVDTDNLEKNPPHDLSTFGARLTQALDKSPSYAALQRDIAARARCRLAEYRTLPPVATGHDDDEPGVEVSNVLPFEEMQLAVLEPFVNPPSAGLGRVPYWFEVLHCTRATTVFSMTAFTWRMRSFPGATYVIIAAHLLTPIVRNVLCAFLARTAEKPSLLICTESAGHEFRSIADISSVATTSQGGAAQQQQFAKRLQKVNTALAKFKLSQLDRIVLGPSASGKTHHIHKLLSDAEKCGKRQMSTVRKEVFLRDAGIEQAVLEMIRGIDSASRAPHHIYVDVSKYALALHQQHIASDGKGASAATEHLRGETHRVLSNLFLFRCLFDSFDNAHMIPEKSVFYIELACSDGASGSQAVEEMNSALPFLGSLCNVDTLHLAGSSEGQGAGKKSNPNEMIARYDLDAKSLEAAHILRYSFAFSAGNVTVLDAECDVFAVELDQGVGIPFSSVFARHRVEQSQYIACLQQALSPPPQPRPRSRPPIASVAPLHLCSNFITLRATLSILRSRFSIVDSFYFLHWVLQSGLGKAFSSVLFPRLLLEAKTFATPNSVIDLSTLKYIFLPNKFGYPIPWPQRAALNDQSLKPFKSIVDNAYAGLEEARLRCMQRAESDRNIDPHVLCSEASRIACWHCEDVYWADDCRAERLCCACPPINQGVFARVRSARTGILNRNSTSVFRGLR